ncbi:hypothetical protein HRbin41_00371 [bacterium HR41]|nr:hypothetical protein HRbin41_00371 [bacterium HR41]
MPPTNALPLRTRCDGDLRHVALALVRSHGAELLACARRYAQTPEDAEDAYQRGLEILLTKAPTTAPEELLPWLKTVIKHEAFALRRQRERVAPLDDGSPDTAASSIGPAATVAEAAERYEQLRLGAEALGRLKPQEVRALLLRAQGHSYKEICRITGWTYTKVNRCLTEGRQAFAERVRDILAGEACSDLREALSRCADGELETNEVRALRLHLQGCLACRRALREYRRAASTVAALVPPAVASAPADGGGSWLDWLAATVGERIWALAVRLQPAGEIATAKKAAAIAASALAVASGGSELAKIASPPQPHVERAAAPPRALGPTAANQDADPSRGEQPPAARPPSHLERTLNDRAAGSVRPPDPAGGSSAQAEFGIEASASDAVRKTTQTGSARAGRVDDSGSGEEAGSSSSPSQPSPPVDAPPGTGATAVPQPPPSASVSRAPDPHEELAGAWAGEF